VTFTFYVLSPGLLTVLLEIIGNTDTNTFTILYQVTDVNKVN